MKVESLLLIVAFASVVVIPEMLRCEESETDSVEKRHLGNMSAPASISSQEDAEAKPAIKPEFVISRNGGVSIEFDRGLRKLDKLSGRTPEQVRAENHGAVGKITIRVVDPEGCAVPFADVNGGFYVGDEKGVPFSARTDTNGLVSIEGLCTGDMNFHIDNPGYYRTRLVYWFPKRGYDCVHDGRWIPWNPTIEVVLKRVVNPIPMYCKTATVVLPEKGKAFGFDCIKGDLVEPFGKGVEADFFFNYSLEYARDNVWNATNYLNITFTTNSGATWLHSDMFSEMKTLYEAPGRGYTNTICFYLRSKDRRNREERKFQPDEYLVFKSRTVVDRNGVETNSFFGKIIPAQFWYGEENKEGIGGQVVFSYYINPTQNDRNIEFDRKNNLFKPDWRDYSWPQEP